MAHHYNDPQRENDPHALPDLEIFFAIHGELQDPDTCEPRESGWYWWPCFPGCLPDGEAVGPFDTEEEALADARQEFDDDGEEARS